jgi:hypothetical protein
LAGLVSPAWQNGRSGKRAMPEIPESWACRSAMEKLIHSRRLSQAIYSGQGGEVLMEICRFLKWT